MLTHVPSYQLGVCVRVWSLPCVSHTHTHIGTPNSMPRLNPALTVDHGSPPQSPMTIHEKKPSTPQPPPPIPNYNKKRQLRLLLKFLRKRPPFCFASHFCLYKICLTPHPPFFEAFTKKEMKKKVTQGQIKAFLEQCSFFLVT